MTLHRRNLLQGVSLSALSLCMPSCAKAGINNPGSGSASPASNGGGMSINPSQASYFTGDNPTLNWLKTSGNYGINCQKSAVAISGASPASINYVAHASSVGTSIA